VVAATPAAWAGGLSFTNTIKATGLQSNDVRGVAYNGSSVYAATAAGLSITTNGGSSWTTKTTANGLGSNSLNWVAVNGSSVYAATSSGLSISTNGGASFTNSNSGSSTSRVFVSGSNVYYTAGNNLGISTDGGSSFTTKALQNYNKGALFVDGGSIYVGHNGSSGSPGLGKSTDGGGEHLHLFCPSVRRDNQPGQQFNLRSICQRQQSSCRHQRRVEHLQQRRHHLHQQRAHRSPSRRDRCGQQHLLRR
jgi:hypothetical protein